LFHVKQARREGERMPVQRGWIFSRRGSGPDRADQPGEGTGPSGGGAVLCHLSADAIEPNPYQPRHLSSEDEAALAELAASIRTHGLLQPVLVARRGNGYVLVAGERRWKAARLAGLATVPALVGEFGPRELAEKALIENLQRQDLSCLEEAAAYRRLLDEFRLTQEELAASVGRSQPSIANKLRLLRLPEGIRASISREILTEGHARALLMLDSAELQERAHAEIIQRRLSVRETEDLVRGLVDGSRSRKVRRAKRQQVVKVFKDARLFRNSLLALVAQMRQGGAAVELEEAASPDCYEVHLKVRRKAEQNHGQEARGEKEGRQWARS
jgi:ParB family chromosome partitioning protein